MSGLSGLGMLYGSSATSVTWEESDGGFRWQGRLLGNAELAKIEVAINYIFEWSGSNVELISGDDFLGNYCEQERVRNAIKNNGVARNISGESYVPGSGDGACYLYWCLSAIKEFVIAARVRQSKVLFVVQL
jgi:hypothetical protein